MLNVEQTIISQYANSATLVQLVQGMDAWIDPRADLDNFYNAIWNIDTAQGNGLDIWGRIVGVSRNIPNASADPSNLGFTPGPTGLPFGQAPFKFGWVGVANALALADDAYRTLILVKALSNISVCSAPALNQMLQNLFAGRGRCYVIDMGLMRMDYVFEFALAPDELSIITNSGAFPRPAAVRMNVINTQPATTFGFKDSGLQPFGSGNFFTPIQVPYAA
ncbi:MAG: DUF2612 domain-containing protein [Burkholderiaceae bacterium]|jgi:hypothetical protein|nr:DUF2612 domain-containing protein [Burkholderiaceae bacterium]